MKEENTAPSTETPKVETAETIEKAEDTAKSESPVSPETPATETTTTASASPTPTPKKKSLLGIIIIILAILIIIGIGASTAFAMFMPDKLPDFMKDLVDIDLDGTDTDEDADEDTDEDATSTDEATIDEDEEAILEGPADIKLMAWTVWNEGDHQFYLYAKKADALREVGIFASSVSLIDWVDDDHFAFLIPADDYVTATIEVYDWSTDTYTTVHSFDQQGQFFADFLNPDVFIYKKIEIIEGDDTMNMSTSYWMNDMDADYSLSTDTVDTLVYGREGMLYDASGIKLSPDNQYFFSIDTGPSSNQSDDTYYFVDVYLLDHDDGMYWAEYVTTITSATYPFWRDNDSIAYFGNPSPRKLMQYDIDSGVTTELGDLAGSPHAFSYNPVLDVLLYQGDEFTSVSSNAYQFDLDSGDNTLLDYSVHDFWAGDNVVLQQNRVACMEFCGLVDFDVTGVDLVSYPSLAVQETLVDGFADFLTCYQ